MFLCKQKKNPETGEQLMGLSTISLLQAWGLTIVRVTLGTIFIAHGSQKVFGWFGGPGLESFVGWASSFGIPGWLGYLAAFAELIGGCLLLTGIAAEIGALLVIPVMIGAVVIVHWKQGYFAQNGGFEYPLNLLLFALAIVVGGPGKLALWDLFLEWRKNLL
jgi:putative oxidoreductase